MLLLANSLKSRSANQVNNCSHIIIHIDICEYYKGLDSHLCSCASYIYAANGCHSYIRLEVNIFIHLDT